ncbi:MAG: hypothetical protein IKD31_05945 [Clostridia bacterium]|nr:hypothetical protein [Clostridia bacterium]
MKKRLLCFFLGLWMLLIPCLVSCESSDFATVTETAEEESSADKTAVGESSDSLRQMTPMDEETARIVGDLSAALTNKLTAAQLAELPLATAEMSKDELRRLCIDFFKLQLSFQWIPNETVTDYPVTRLTTSKTLDLGSVYVGIPYQSTGTGNLYRWMEYYYEDLGVFDLTAAFRENGGTARTDVQKDDKGNVTYYKRRCMMIFFNQCSVSSFWGWGRVINSADFAWTGQMNVACGFIPVGDYSYGYTHGGKFYGPETITSFGEKNSNNPLGYDTDDVIADWLTLKGSNAMFLCYAEMKPADCLVSPGHAMMVEEVHPVYYKNGTINPDESYALICEQTEKWCGEGTLTGTAIPYKMQGAVSRKYSFSALQKSHYLPFTFAEFLEEGDPRLKSFSSSVMTRYEHFADLVKDKTGTAVEKAEVYCTEEFGGTINITDFKKMAVGSNYPISDVFVTVRDQDGKAVLTNVHRTAIARIREVEMTAQHASWKMGATISDGLTRYLSGAYTVEVSLQLSTGEKLLAYRGTLSAY